MLRGWNRIKGDSLAGRRVLYLHLPVAPGAREGSREAEVASKRSRRHHPAGTELAEARPTEPRIGESRENESRYSGSRATESRTTVKRHTVRRGETLYSIANSYNTTVSALKKDNRNTAALRPGMILIVRDAR